MTDVDPNELLKLAHEVAALREAFEDVVANANEVPGSEGRAVSLDRTALGVLRGLAASCEARAGTLCESAGLAVRRAEDDPASVEPHAGLLLDTGFTPRRQDPTLDDVLTALEASISEPESPFVILSRGESFVQTYHNGKYRFTVEYRLKEDGPQWSGGDDNALDTAARVFEVFHGEGDVTTLLPWTELEDLP